MKSTSQAELRSKRESVSLRMKNTRAQNDGERAVRSILFRRGVRFRVNMALPSLRTRPDLTFPRLKVAVYLDGCFWHGCPDHATTPGTNQRYWTQKLLENVERDRRIVERLRLAGWKVLRLWVHEPAEAIADKIQSFVEQTAREQKPC